MKAINQSIQASSNEYCGRILTGNFSESLKDYISECVNRFKSFDQAGTPAIPYISAWQENQNIIWYEFIGKRLIALLGCDYSNSHDIFRNSIIERHVYNHKNYNKGIKQNIIKSKMIKTRRHGLREEAKIKGTIEAVYKLCVDDDKTFWLKDQATIESFKADGINISLGCLTMVTKEMEAEEQLKHTQKALKRSRKKFREQSIRDNLTGLYNTRYLYKALSKLIANCSKNQSFSLIFMDIDNFKDVVDTHGHLNASQALQEIASTIKNILQDPAYAVAYGGDEFVVVLPGFAKPQATDIAETIRQRIKETNYLQKVGLKVRVSASFGISTYPHDANTLSELLALADQAMFSVKERGKDSVCSISPRTAKDVDGTENIFSYNCKE
jgi:diguanylate cyclase (GGDEF)-like protein